MAKHIIIAVTNDLLTDQRVAKVAHTLLDRGYNITLVGRRLRDSAHVDRPYIIKRFKLCFNSGALFYANYNVRLFFYLLFKRFDAVLSNDLDTLLACYCSCKLKSKPIIYDSHEYFTEVPELVNRKLQQSFWLKIEGRIVPKLNFAYTVCESIAKVYTEKYKTSFMVVRNLPTRKIAVNEPKQNVLIYQGVLNVGRGIELMIETMKYLNDYSLWIAGAGDIEDKLHNLVHELKLEEKVKFLGRIPLNDLHALTSKAKLGLSFEEDLGLNYRFALPNKMFDYIQAQIPVLVADLPEMANIVEKYEVGELLKNRDPKQIAAQLEEMLADNEKILQWNSKLKIASKELCWENEKQILLSIFEKALPLT